MGVGVWDGGGEIRSRLPSGSAQALLLGAPLRTTFKRVWADPLGITWCGAGCGEWVGEGVWGCGAEGEIRSRLPSGSAQALLLGAPLRTTFKRGWADPLDIT